MRLLVPRETRPGERRVAVVPSVVAKFTQLGFEVVVESGAGDLAFATDADYSAAGALVVPTSGMDDAFAAADVVASVRPLDYGRAKRLRRGAVAVSFLSPAIDLDTVRGLHDSGATGLSFDLVPRISRAQSMDALTSQALVTGYRAALVAADRLPKFFPLFMTAAGTIQPARVLVLGAGVAGLQAIATAKRLGARVSAYDVRAASADEVRSMGATFIQLDLDVIEGSGGYAREMTEDRAQRQRDLLSPHIAESDVVITTAAVPGRQAPLLVTRAMVEGMKPGSVVADLAAETGGNVAGTVAGREVRVGPAHIVGPVNLPSRMPVHTSEMLSKNLFNFIAPLLAEGLLKLDWDDEVVAGTALTHAGEVKHPVVKQVLGL